MCTVSACGVQPIRPPWRCASSATEACSSLPVAGHPATGLASLHALRTPHDLPGGDGTPRAGRAFRRCKRHCTLIVSGSPARKPPGSCSRTSPPTTWNSMPMGQAWGSNRASGPSSAWAGSEPALAGAVRGHPLDVGLRRTCGGGAPARPGPVGCDDHPWRRLWHNPHLPSTPPASTGRQAASIRRIRTGTMRGRRALFPRGYNQAVLSLNVLASGQTPRPVLGVCDLPQKGGLA